MLSDLYICVILNKEGVQQIHKLCGQHGRREFVLKFVAKNSGSPQKKRLFVFPRIQVFLSISSSVSAKKLYCLKPVSTKVLTNAFPEFASINWTSQKCLYCCYLQVVLSLGSISQWLLLHNLHFHPQKLHNNI